MKNPKKNNSKISKHLIDLAKSLDEMDSILRKNFIKIIALDKDVK